MHLSQTLRRAAPLALAFALVFVFTAVAQEPVPEQTSTAESNLFRPRQLEFQESLLECFQLPAGFQVNVFASGMGRPRMMMLTPDGTVMISRRGTDDVVALRDGDGVADMSMTVLPKLREVHGLEMRGSTVYLATDNELYTTSLRPDGMVEQPRSILRLPDAGQHPNRVLAFGPDGMLYLSVGSTCNACAEPNEESATLLRMMPDGSDRSVYARGLRNTIGFGWHPETGQLWGMDHGSDSRGDDQPPEELNRLEQGKQYGWPYCFGDRQVDLYIQGEPEGSFQGGQPVAIEDFMTAFLTDGGTAQFGRPVGLAQLPDGSLLVGDDTNGVIYRVSYAGGS